MAQMNRNVNLEEIDSDALFGIDALKNQTFFQKIIFFGSVLAGVATNVMLPIFFHTPRMICIFLFLAFLLVGVAFGCNYTDDMTYGTYMYYFFCKPRRHLVFRSTEDLKVLKVKAQEMKREEEIKLQRQKQASPEEQRKLLIKMGIFFVVLAVIIAAAFMFGGKKESKVKHHVVKESVK